MKTKRVKVRELDVFEVSGVEGDEYHVDIPSGVEDCVMLRSQVANIVIYSRGEVALTYENYPGEVGRRVAGLTTIKDHWQCPNPGRVTYEVVSPSFMYYCIKDRKNRHLKAEEFRLSKGELVTIPAQKNVFVALGSIQVNDRQLTAPAQVLTEREAEVIATSDVVGAVFERYTE